jgi:hypothetical protein
MEKADSLLLGFAHRLTFPDQGDIEFECKTKDGMSRSLFAHQWVLSENCEYFNTRT